jgi:hypothetical protein
VASHRLAIHAHIVRTRLISLLRWAVPWLGFGVVLTMLAYQIPVQQRVTIGYNDAGWVQGFEDATNRWGVVTDATGTPGPYRWTGVSSALLFPQIGLPARATIRLRGWRPPGEESPRVRVLLNGRDLLGTLGTSSIWEEHSFPIRSGLLKPQDVFLQLETEPIMREGTMLRGVQVDQATLETTGWPIIPYPGQVVGGALATLLAAALLQRGRWAVLAACALAMGFVLVYRVAILPFAVRSYWLWVCGALLTVLLARNMGHRMMLAVLDARWRTRLFDSAAVCVVVVWTAVVARAAQAHVVLSLPGVEKDFRVFATRSDAWWCPPGAFDGTANCVWRADGFYQLGYPALLWALRPLTSDNPFWAAQVVALVSGAILLGSTYVLARRLLGPAAALVALLALALNRWTTAYSLYLGTDMPFAASCTVALLLLLTSRGSPVRIIIAGVACGAAFLKRHPGIVLIPLGCVWLWFELQANHTRRGSLRGWLASSGLLLAGCILVSFPQLIVNVSDTGSPLYSEQAKNVWLAVYGNTDWSRWSEARNDIALGDVILHDPGRFMSNWWGNFRAFWGTGSEDTSEFGRALGLRLLAFPANMLTIVGVVIWIARGNQQQRWLLLITLTYIAAIAVGFMLPRFCLLLMPIAAIAAAQATQHIWEHVARNVRIKQVVVAGYCVAVVVLAGSVGAGEREVLGNQEPDAVRAVALVNQTLGETESLAAYLPADDFLAKYSAVAHRVDTIPSSAPTFALYTDDAAVAALPQGEFVGRAGRYVLERILP